MVKVRNKEDAFSKVIKAAHVRTQRKIWNPGLRRSDRSSDKSQAVWASTGGLTTLMQSLPLLAPGFLHHQIVSRLTLALPLPPNLCSPTR